MSEHNEKTIAPYGSWESPIEATMLVSGAVGISEVVPEGDAVWWAESRPEEAGRVAIMRNYKGITVEITPSEANVRTLMHEYGGGAWWVSESVLFYVDYTDQRLRQLTYRDETAEAEITLLSAKPDTDRGQRFADMRPTTDGLWVISVCEHHDDALKEPANFLCAIARDGSGRQIELASGADFYGSVCLSPNGNHIAWVQWACSRW